MYKRRDQISSEEMEVMFMDRVAFEKEGRDIGRTGTFKAPCNKS